MTMEEILIIRKYIMAYLLLTCGGNRGDHLRNMTLKEFNNKVLDPITNKVTQCTPLTTRHRKKEQPSRPSCLLTSSQLQNSTENCFFLSSLHGAKWDSRLDRVCLAQNLRTTQKSVTLLLPSFSPSMDIILSRLTLQWYSSRKSWGRTRDKFDVSLLPQLVCSRSKLLKRPHHKSQRF